MLFRVSIKLKLNSSCVIRPFKARADLIGCRLLSAGVFVSERPIEGGDVDAAASLAHEVEPRLEDGGVSGAGVKLQTFRDALHQNDPDTGNERRY